MKKIQDQLATISKSLAALSKQVDKLSKQAGKQTKKPAVKAAKPKSKAKAKKAAPVDKNTVLDTVYDVIRRARNGASIAKLKEKTKLDSRQLSNALYKLSKKGMVEAKSRGHYIKKK